MKMKWVLSTIDFDYEQSKRVYLESLLLFFGNPIYHTTPELSEAMQYDSFEEAAEDKNDLDGKPDTWEILMVPGSHFKS